MAEGTDHYQRCMELPDLVFHSFRQILAGTDQTTMNLFSDSFIKNMIDYLNGEKPTTTLFTSIATTKLRSLRLNPSTGEMVFSNNKAKNTVMHREGNKGSYGILYRSIVDPNIVYKEVRIQPDIEENVRNFFLEIFIQIVLASDPDLSNHIPKIYGIYRGQTKDETLTLIVKMKNIPYRFEEEFIPYKLEQYGVEKLTIKHISKEFAQLGSILEIADTKYGFRHRDLHLGNIMFDSDWNIVLIDFGMSCLKIGEVVYILEPKNSSLAKHIQCDLYAYDILMFLTHILSTKALEYSLWKFIRNLLISSNGYDIIKYIKNQADENGSLLIHEVYYWDVANWAPEYRDALPYVQALVPSEFKKLWVMKQSGGRLSRKKGGFAPSIMGSFILNVESAIVPAVMYTLYHMYVPKKNTNKTRKQTKNTNYVSLFL